MLFTVCDVTNWIEKMSDLFGKEFEGTKLVLFFTRGVSLQTWDSVGMFDREVALYQQLQQHGVDVTFVTYGNREDLRYAERLPGIRLCCNRLGLPAGVYEKCIPWLHRNSLREADIIKTNQTNGAEIALRAANYYNKPFIARCGYMWSKNLSIELGEQSRLAQLSRKIEEMVFLQAQHIVVTSVEMLKDISGRFPAAATHTTVVPNYVDTEKFSVGRINGSRKRHLCFVGRLAPEKNLETLLLAIEGLDVELDIIGEGPLRSLLERKAVKVGGVHFHGRVPNQQLSDYFHRSSAFVFPSLYEGHPKTPIEAMACGLPVVGCDVSGVREVVTHNKTGLLCKTDPVSLRKGIKNILSDEILRKRLGREARKFVVENYSLERILRLELEIYQNILQDNRA